MDDVTPEMKVNWAISAAIKAGDADSAQRLLQEHPSIRDRINTLGSWLFAVAKTPHLNVAEMMIGLRMDVNLSVGVEQQTPLHCAIDFDQFEMTQFLLSRGANPNISRPIISAINCDPEERALTFLKLLVEHGADVNRTFVLFGKKDKLFTALDWASGKPTILKYLQDHDAKSSWELVGEKSAFPPKK